MHSYFIVLTLPSIVRKQVSLICRGLPAVNWIEEENLHLTLRSLGPLNDQQLLDVKEQLQTLVFPSFTFSLKGVEATHTKRNKGQIWVNIYPDSQCLKLRKEIDFLLKGMDLAKEERPFHPNVTLGYYESLDSHRLAQYLMEHHFYQLDSIAITSCALLYIQHTPKRTFYQQVEQYPLITETEEI